MHETFLQAIVFVAGLYVVLIGVIEANYRRDLVIMGVAHGVPMTADHRRLVLINDWLPLKFGLALLCSVSGMAVYELSPVKAFAELTLATKSMLIASGFCTVVLVIYGILDLIYCLRLVRSLRS